LAPFGDRVEFVQTRYDGFWAERNDQNQSGGGDVDGVLFDLGVSSMQLDRVERGFSYSHDAPLDMRMDQDAPLTAAEILNTYDKRALTRVLQEFGEERFASRIAAEIVRRRVRKPFETTAELVEVLYDVIPIPARRTGGHPGKRTFQALRTAVNGELDSLRSAVPAALAALREGGRIVVLAYQSLEDRIVKGEFAAATASRTPAGLPMELPGHEPYFVSLTRGAEKAGADEIDLNPRSASVRLRALEKVVRREGS
jgi:16S rRNA (cytosine1402-N4)-methyltransferase